MKSGYSSAGISLRLWIVTALLFGLGLLVFFIITEDDFTPGMLLLSLGASIIGSVPALLCMLIGVPIINHFSKSCRTKFAALLTLLFLLTLPYAIAVGVFKLFSYEFNFGEQGAGFVVTVAFISFSQYAAALLATALVLRPAYFYFNQQPAGPISRSDIFRQLFY